MHYLSKGKRGVVYLAKEKGKLVVFKKERPGSAALRALHNEAQWLQRLNRHGIGPLFVRFDNDTLVMEYIDGVPFVDWYPRQKKDAIHRVIREIFDQCYLMDSLHVNKMEMHHPVKHILIRSGKPVMIDFERCKQTMTPKNVTQFAQFLSRLGFTEDHETMRRLLQNYKKSYDKKMCQRIVRCFTV